MIKSMKMLGNSTRSLLLFHKRLLYKTCILPVALYSFPLWFFKNASLSHPLKELIKIQWKAALWITRAFQTSSTWGVEAIADLISIHFHLDKISECQQLRTTSLSSNHMVKLVLEYYHSNNLLLHCLSLDNLISKQRLKG